MIPNLTSSATHVDLVIIGEKLPLLFVVIALISIGLWVYHTVNFTNRETIKGILEELKRINGKSH